MKATDRLHRKIGFLGHPSAVLTYHVIAPKASKYIYSTSCNQFEEHLKWISELRHAERVPYSLPEVTFDDGKTSDYQYGLPLLQQYGNPGIFFVTVGRIGTADFMNWEQVREIASMGHAVQSHGWSHLLLTRAKADELTMELEWSRKTLEDHLDSRVTSLSLPGGRWNAKVLRACSNAGYERVYHSDPWRPVQILEGTSFVGRLMVRNTMSADQLRRLFSGNRGELLLLRSQHELKGMFKGLVGDGLYHSIWRGARHLATLVDGARQRPPKFPSAEDRASSSGERP